MRPETQIYYIRLRAHACGCRDEGLMGICQAVECDGLNLACIEADIAKASRMADQLKLREERLYGKNPGCGISQSER